MRTYFDSSAIMDSLLNPGSRKFPVSVESSEMFTSKLTQVEVLRNITRIDPSLLTSAVELLTTLQYIEIDDQIISHAAFYPETISLRTLDAIHMASAEQVLDVDDLLITYDKQMARNADLLGIKVFTSF